MVPTTRDRARFAVLFVPYACGLILWLVLGILPTLAADVPVVHHQIAQWAEHSLMARRILHPMFPGSMGPDRTSTGQAVLQYAFSLLNLGLGLVLALRLAGERVPRLLAFALLGTAATFNMPSHRAFHITGTPWPITLIHFVFHIVSGVTYLWAVVLFPDGRLPHRLRLGPRQLRAAAAAVTVIVVFVSWRGSFLAHPQFFVVFFGIVVPLAGVGSQALRLTDPGTTPADRRVTRLLVGALLPALVTGSLWLGGHLAGGLGWSAAQRFDGHVQTWFPAVFALVPIVLFAGVIRYRLWDVDRALANLLGYAAIACVVGAGYVVAVTAGASVVGGGMLATVVVLTVVAVAIEPLRLRARRWANRVIYGQDLSPTEAMRSLVSGLESLSPTGEIDQLTEVAVRATRARSAALWLADGAEWTVASVHPAQAAAPGREQSWPVRYQGELLGVLAIGGEPTAADRALIGDLAAHAGIVVQNALLTVQLARQVVTLTEQTDQLRRTRRRLVEAQDAERRRLERNLHDGAQQELVAVIAAVGTVEATGSSGEAMTRLTGGLRRMLAEAKASVLELCGDGRPLPLVELGLDGALRRLVDLAGQSGVHAVLEMTATDLAPEVEAAVYFCCAEALQNVTKHARATTAAVSVRRSGSWVDLRVTDDGRGFDPSTANGDGGLAALYDRLAAVGGTLEAASAPGHGSAIRASIPVSA
jgi:signal transduction histidine kinase